MRAPALTLPARYAPAPFCHAPKHMASGREFYTQRPDLTASIVSGTLRDLFFFQMRTGVGRRVGLEVGVGDGNREGI